jgi:site-specific recombinase XerD
MLTMREGLRVLSEGLAQRGRSRRTIATYIQNLTRLNRELGGLFVAPDVLAAKLKEWRSSKQRRLACGELSASAIRGDLAALRSLFRELRAAGLYEGDPTVGVIATKVFLAPCP